MYYNLFFNQFPEIIVAISGKKHIAIDVNVFWKTIETDL